MIIVTIASYFMQYDPANLKCKVYPPLQSRAEAAGGLVGSGPHSVVLELINTTWCQVVPLAVFTFRETMRFTAVV